MRILDQRRIIHQDNSKFIKIRIPVMQEPAKIFGAFRRRDLAEDIAVDIIKTDGPRAKNVVRVDQLGLVFLNAVHFDETIVVIDVEKHDPSGRRKKEFKFRKVPLKVRIEVKITQRFIVEQVHPKNDKNRDPYISSAVGHTRLRMPKDLSRKKPVR